MMCVNCQKFPGNGKPCKDEDEPKRVKIYSLDMTCGNFVKVVIDESEAHTETPQP